jgi:hypothetical protein
MFALHSFSSLPTATPQRYGRHVGRQSKKTMFEVIEVADATAGRRDGKSIATSSPSAQPSAIAPAHRQPNFAQSEELVGPVLPQQPSTTKRIGALTAVDGVSEIKRPTSDSRIVDRGRIEVSVVMPCLNEEESVGICVTKAFAGLATAGRLGEVIVCDNGSTDSSVAVAEAAGATVVHQARRGYGNAYLLGFSEASGSMIVMGDSDDSYDFTELGVLVDKLESGYDYVLGSRFCGEIRAGAMTWSHRNIGNPVLTAVLNRMFGLKSTDAHSGMRAFTREALERMALRCEGMEFASEIVVKAAFANLRVAEVPIIYRPRIGISKLHTFRDGWRHLRFLLAMSPKYLFLFPGIIMTVVGVVGEAVVLLTTTGQFATRLSEFAAITAVGGLVAVVFGTFTAAFLQEVGFRDRSQIALWLEGDFSLERGLVGAAGLIVAGLALDVVTWVGGADHPNGPAWGVAALMLMALGVIVLFGAFFLSIFRLRFHRPNATMPSRERVVDPVMDLSPPEDSVIEIAD